ncbi:ATP-dependent DNA ligase [Planctomycetota bacterium]|nr:ATP-dependent DNA ligase [Planctomycetota bacterium]
MAKRKETFIEIGGREVRVSSPDKVVFPEQGWTKLDVVNHFVLTAEGALRGVHDRPVSLKRWTKGVSQKPMFVKRPKGARQLVNVKFPSARPGQMFLPLDQGDVIWMAHMNCIDLNPWNFRASDLEHPDELRIDLDPTEGFTFEHVRELTGAVKELLDDLGLVGWPKTSGKRGVHIYVRLRKEWDTYQVRRAGLAFGRELERRHDLATTAWWKEERSGVFVDYNQNAWDKTIASAYSVRETGLVSTPFRWDELESVNPSDYDMGAFPARWDAVGDLTQGIDEAEGGLERLLEMVAEDEQRGQGEAPWPPHYPKMPGEPPRVQPSKKKMDG